MTQPEKSITAVVDAETAYRLIAAAGVERVDCYPAVDEIRLGKGAGLLKHWKGDDGWECAWERVHP